MKLDILTVTHLLEHAGVGQVEIARYVGHKVGTMAGDTYSEGGDRAGALGTAKRIRHSQDIEDAALVLANREG